MGIFQKIFGRIQQSFASSIPDDDNIDLTKVFPKIKALYDDETLAPEQEGKTLEISQDESPIYDPLAKGLGIFYALDKGDHYLLLQQRHLSDTISLEKLREVALNNLTREVLEKTQLNGDPSNIIMLINGGNFEATMMLVDSLWGDMERMFNDQICIAIPARDLLFIAGRDNPMGRESLRSVVRNAFDNPATQGLLVRHIYARENNQWVVLETA